MLLELMEVPHQNVGFCGVVSNSILVPRNSYVP